MHAQIRDYWVTFNAPLEGAVDWLYRGRRGWDETVQEMSAPSEQERAASLRSANEVVWTHVDALAPRLSGAGFTPLTS